MLPSLIVSDMVLSGGRDGQLKLWALASNNCECIATLALSSDAQGQPQPVQGVAGSARTGFVAAAGDDKIVVWRPVKSDG